MKNNKRGFTLAEVLICLVVIGVIMAISVQTIKIVRASYSSLAYFEFLNIQKMAGEMIAGVTPEIIKENGGGTIIPTIYKKTKTGQYITTITNINQDFCKFIVALSNATGPTSCSSLPDVGLEGPNGEKEPSLVIDKEGNQDLYNNPVFVSTSGRRYYISKRVISRNEPPVGDPETKINYNDTRIVSDEYGYRIIAVDLNGTQGPNTTKYNDRKIPDIVNFMILDNGEVFPLGVAADNIKLDEGINQEINGKKIKERTVLYINSKVKGFYFGHDDTRTTSPRECTIKGSAGGKRCNFGVIYVPNQNATGQNFFFSYREAYCSTLGTRESAYVDYCAGQPYHSLCPPSEDEKSFDVCRVENIKPAFRYNF